MGLPPHYIAKKEMIEINGQITTKVKYPNKLSKAKQSIKTFFEIIEDTVLNQPDVDLNYHYVKGVKDTIKWAKAYCESMNVKYIDVEVEDD